MTNSIPIYIINLKRNPERRLHIKRQLDVFGLEYQFIDVDDIDKYELESKSCRSRVAQSLGIDALVLENKYHAILDNLKARYRDTEYEKHKNANLGALATTLSHIKIYDLMVKNNIAAACILEDDVTLLPTFPKILNAATKLEWDILLLASQPSQFKNALIWHPDQCNHIKRMRVFNKLLIFFNRYLIFVHKRIENYDSKEQKSRITSILEEYGFDPSLHTKQAKIVTKTLQEYDAKCDGIIGTIAPTNRRLFLMKRTHYSVYNALYKKFRYYIKLYAQLRLGALPEKSSLKRISDDHHIAKPRNLPLSATGYLVKQSAAMKWKRRVLTADCLVIDQIPWQLYQYQKVKLRLVTPPCTTATYHYLVYSARRR